MRFVFCFLICFVFSFSALADDNIKCANHWRQPVESELTADFQSDWQAQLGGNGDTSGFRRMVLHFSSDLSWTALVHYQKTIWGGYKATIGSDDFYNAGQIGRTDPKAELEATIRLFESDENTQKKCLFPARYLLLKKQNFVQKDFPSCKEYEEFKNDLKPDGITLLFTDAYMNNSSSLFGHTLLRIDTKRQGTQMLAHGVNYGAFTKGYENSIFYAVYGLLGFYSGGLTVKPYFDIINTYNNIENRDIWEYHLDLTKEQTEMFVAHIWEIGQTMTPYYFFSQNCSYMLLEMIDAVKPDLKLAQSFPLWAIPLDTVKIVSRKGVIGQVHYRPSRFRKIKYRLNQMSKQEKEALIEVIQNNEADLSALGDDEKADVLETAYQYVQYQYVAKKLELKEYRKKSFQILKLRNQNKSGQSFDDLKEGQNPVKAHDSKSATLAAGFQNGRAFEELRFRPAYHSLTDNPNGYLKGAAINFLESVFRHYDHHDKYVLEKLNILELDSFSPVDRLFSAPSYRVFVSLERAYNLKAKKEGYVLSADVHLGGTYALSDLLWIYGFAGPHAGYGGFLKDNAYAGLSFSGGVLYSGDKIGLQAELKKVIATQKQSAVFEQSAVLSFHLKRNTDLEAKFLRKTYENKSLNEITFAIKQFF